MKYLGGMEFRLSRQVRRSEDFTRKLGYLRFEAPYGLGGSDDPTKPIVRLLRRIALYFIEICNKHYIRSLRG